MDDQEEPRPIEELTRQSPPATVPTVPSETATPPVSCAAADPAALPEQFGRYRIIQRLGRGGMGSVYLAHDSQLDRRVALKVPHFRPDEDRPILARFYREARAAAGIQHPNLCPVYDVGQQGGIPYLTMAYLEGQPLSEYARAGGFLPPTRVAVLLRQLALALQEAHAQGVIHRDLKPSNIMINSRGEPVVMDFGLARRSSPAEARLTQSGGILGTPAYMAPEQVAGDLSAIGASCDIYGLGVILYELLTGRVPFEGSPAVVLAHVLTQEPDPPSRHRSDVDPRLEAICRKAMARKIGDRYATMAELAAALSDFLDQAAAEPETKVCETGDGSSEAKGSRRPLRTRWRWLAAGGIAVVILGGGLLALVGSRHALPRDGKAPAIAPTSAAESRAAPLRSDATIPAEKGKAVAWHDVADVDSILRRILADVREVPAADRRFVRYFRVAGANADELNQQREALTGTIQHLRRERPVVQLRPIDAPVNTLYRIDLRDLGWEQQPYARGPDRAAGGRRSLNLFDLVLLEYPYGIVSEGSETFDQLAQEFLLPAEQVRPIPYVRADWFVSTVTQPPLAEDLLQRPLKGQELRTSEAILPVARRFRDAPLQLANAAAELGLTDSSELRAVFRAPQLRDTWEDDFDRVVRGLRLGVPIVPLDAVGRRTHPAGTPPVVVDLQTSKKVFGPGDELVILVTNRSDRPVYIELIGTSARGLKVVLTPSDTLVQPGQVYRYPPDRSASIRVRSDPGKEQVTLFASDQAFPPGVLLRGKGVSDRFVHPFYELQLQGGRVRLSFDPVRIVKKTIEIETR